MTSIFSRLIHNRIFHNVLTLYGVQACTYLLPLITFPYLARILGPKGWGAVLFAQSLGAIVALIVEYGFDFSGTREVARNVEDRSRLRDLVAGILGAKLALCLLCTLAALALHPLASRWAISDALFWGSIVWGIGQGVNMLWYFQGLQRMQMAGGLDIAGKVLATASIFLVVHRPEDGWKFMAAQALGCIFSHTVTVITAYREVGVRWPNHRLIADALRIGWPMFMFKGAQSLLVGANGIILGIFASPTALGFYAGADKISQVARQGLWPVTQALFPHQSTQVTADPREATRTVRMSLVLLGSLGLLFGLVLFIGAPWIVRLMLGPSFEAAIPTLRIFALVIPLVGINAVLSFQWMVPLGMDREFNLVILLSGMVNVALGIVLASLYSHVGMAIAVVLAQLFTIVALHVVLRRARLSPFSRMKLITTPAGKETALKQEAA